MTNFRATVTIRALIAGGSAPTLLSMLMANVGATDGIDDGFGNVGGMVADTLNGLSDEQVVVQSELSGGLPSWTRQA